MASLTYDSFWDDALRATIDVDTDTFYVMLVTSSYTPNKGTHSKRSDVTNEVTGTGYSSGGIAVTLTVTKDTGNHRVTIQPATSSWASASITARGAVLYKRRGGAATADELVAYADFGADVTSTSATFQATFTTPITLQN